MTSRTEGSSCLIVSVFSVKYIARSLFEGDAGGTGRWLAERGVEWSS